MGPPGFRVNQRLGCAQRHWRSWRDRPQASWANILTVQTAHRPLEPTIQAAVAEAFRACRRIDAGQSKGGGKSRFAAAAIPVSIAQGPSSPLGWRYGKLAAAALKAARPVLKTLMRRLRERCPSDGEHGSVSE